MSGEVEQLLSKWSLSAIEQIAASHQTAIAIGPFGSRMKADCYVDKGVPVIRGANLTSGRKFVGDFVYITEQKADELLSANVFPGDLVFPHRGAIGEVGIVPDKPYSRWVLSSSLMKLTCNKEKADPTFIYYYFKTAWGRYELLKNASTVGTPGIGQPLTSLRSIIVPTPPLPTQRRIAEILGRLDDKIEVNRRINRTLEAMAQALFKHWFVDFGPFQEGEFVESELGLIPKGWEVSHLKQLFPKDKNCVITGPFGSNLHASDYRDEGTPLILVKHVESGYVLENDLPLVGSHKLPEMKRYLLKEGDIVFTRVGVVGQSAYIHKRNVGWMISGQMLRVRVNDRRILNPRYLAQAFLTESFIKMVEAHAVGSTRPSLNTELLATFKFLVPPIEVQNKFSQTALKLDAQIQNNLAENWSLATTRDYLLPKLLSGEVVV